MLLAIAAVLLVLWLLGLFVFHLGAIIHALIVIAVIVAIVHFVRGRGARV
jgi:predicted ferric reductase